MNKVILMGRLTRDPEVRYSQGSEPIAVARYSLAVNRRFKRDGEPDADFINCVAFGKTGEFAERYFKKGQMVSIVGRLQVRSWEDQTGQKRWSTDVVVEEQFFAESKSSFESHRNQEEGMSGGSAPVYTPKPPQPSAPPAQSPQSDGFFPIDESIEDDDLPF